MKGKTAIGTDRTSGSALLVVLLMLGVVAVLAAAVARSVSGAALELSAARVNAESDSDLRAGIELGVAAILKLGDDMRSAEAAVDLSGRRLSVQVTNERARIDLNKAKADVLAGLLQAEGLDGNEAASLAANIVQWRGGAASEGPTTAPQSDHNLPGQPQWASFSSSRVASRQPPKAVPALHFFMHPIQLVFVPGFSKALVRRLLPFLTVANGANQIDPFIAAPDVLNALPGASNSKVEAFLDAREGNVSRETALQLLGVDKELLSEDRATGWRIQITSTPRRAGRIRRSEAVVAAVHGDGDDPYQVLYVAEDTDHLRDERQ